MPGYKVHLIGGFSVFMLIIVLIGGATISFPVAFEWLIMTLLGSLFPDIDTKSKGQKLFYRLLGVVYIFLIAVQRWTSLILLSCLALLPLLGHHRGIFHNAWFVASLAFLATGYCCICAPTLTRWVAFDSLFFVAGAWSHLLLDQGFSRTFGLRNFYGR